MLVKGECFTKPTVLVELSDLVLLVPADGERGGLPSGMMLAVYSYLVPERKKKG